MTHTPPDEWPVMPPFLIDLCMAALNATRAWSTLRDPIPELDPAMHQLREVLRPLLAWYQSTIQPSREPEL